MGATAGGGTTAAAAAAATTTFKTRLLLPVDALCVGVEVADSLLPLTNAPATCTVN